MTSIYSVAIVNMAPYALTKLTVRLHQLTLVSRAIPSPPAIYDDTILINPLQKTRKG
jgi:hypothetical protein